MHQRSGILFVLATGLLQGCQLLNIQPKLCTMEAVPALTVRVTDETGKSLLNRSTIRVQDGSYVDSLTVTDAALPAASLAYERSGNYEVRVDRAGYQPWIQKNVRVRKGECHVQTIELEAKLEKLNE
jgi:hypothetical protein